MDWAFGLWFLMCTSQVLSQQILTRQPKWRTSRNIRLSKASVGRQMYNISSKKAIDIDWIYLAESSDYGPTTRGAINKRPSWLSTRPSWLSTRPSRLTTRQTKKRRTRAAKITKRTTRKLNFTRPRLTEGTKKIYTAIGPDDNMSRQPLLPTGTPIDKKAAAWIWEKYLEGRIKADKNETEAEQLAPNKLKGSLVPEPQEEDLLQYVEESSEGHMQLQNTEENYNMIDREDIPLHENYDGGGSHEEANENQLYTENPKQQDVLNVRDQGSRRQHIKLQWPRGIVPFEIDTEIYDDIIIKRILHAMKVIESASCVTFENIDDQKYRTRRFVFRLPYLRITNPQKKRDCVHRIDFGDRAEAVLVLGFDCMQTWDIIHSLLHALGFMDEITHPQRDAYVKVLWENIQPKYRYLFALQNVTLPHKMLVEYDTMSIMHYHDRAYSINGGATIAPLLPGLVIQPSNSLSQLDKMKLRLAFGQECNKRKVEELVETCKFALADSGQIPSQGDDENFDQNIPEHGQDFTVNDLLDHNTENAIDNSVDYDPLVSLDSGQDDNQQNAIDNGSDYNQPGASINGQDDEQQNAINISSDYHQLNAPEDGQDDNHYSDRDEGQVDEQENVFDNGQGHNYETNEKRRFSYTKW